MSKSDDTIRRQDAIKEIARWIGYLDADMILRIQIGLKRLPSTQQWIPVTERLPKEEKMNYWVCTNTGYQCQCRWTNDVYGLGASDSWEWKIFDIPKYQEVVAWMPLPEPWKGEEDEQRRSD